MKNLKAFSETVNFLRANKIYTPKDLKQKIAEVHEKRQPLQDTVKANSKRIKELQRHAEAYAKTKSIHEQLQLPQANELWQLDNKIIPLLVQKMTELSGLYISFSNQEPDTSNESVFHNFIPNRSRNLLPHCKGTSLPGQQEATSIDWVW